MWDYITFWLAQGFAGLIWTLSIIVFLLLLFFLFVAYAHIRCYLCKHDDIFERGTDLNVICNKCGKNLGFTGRFNWNKHRGQ